MTTNEWLHCPCPALQALALPVIEIRDICNVNIPFQLSVKSLLDSHLSFPVIPRLPPVDPRACELCNFTVRNGRSDSTPEDLIMLCYFQRTAGLVPLLRTLRTVGCRATVVVWLDSQSFSQIDFAFKSFLSKCSVLYYNFGDLVCESYEEYVFLRWFLSYDFLLANRFVFDRVIICDGSDVIFQGDPFCEGFNRSSVSLNFETQFGDVGMAEMVTPFFGSDLAHQKIVPFRHINAGAIWGNAQNIFLFLGYFHEFCRKQKRTQFLASAKTFLLNQVIINVFIRANMFRNLTFDVVDCSSVCCCMWDMNSMTFLNKTLGNFTWNSAYPKLVHIYDRFPQFIDSVRDACPQTFGTSAEYIRTTKVIRPPGQD